MNGIECYRYFRKLVVVFNCYKIATILLWLFFTITTTIAHWVEPAPFYLFVGRWYQMVFLSKNPSCASIHLPRSPCFFPGKQCKTQRTRIDDCTTVFWSQNVSNDWSLILYTRFGKPNDGRKCNKYGGLVEMNFFDSFFFRKSMEKTSNVGCLALKEVCGKSATSLSFTKTTATEKKHKKEFGYDWKMLFLLNQHLRWPRLKWL